MSREFPQIDSVHPWPEVAHRTADRNILCELQTRRGSNKAVWKHELEYLRWDQSGALDERGIMVNGHVTDPASVEVTTCAISYARIVANS